MKLKQNIHYIIQRIKLKLIFPLPCTTLCGKPLRRIHFTCLWCRLRRINSGKLDPKKNFKIVELKFSKPLNVPLNHEIYVLFIDNQRRFRLIKKGLLSFMLKVAEKLAHGRTVKGTWKVSELAFNKGLIVPLNHTIYGLYIDNERKHQRIKEKFLKNVLTIAEGLAN